MIIPLPLFHLGVACLYASGAWARWRASRRESIPGVANQNDLTTIYIFASLTLALHAFVLYKAIGAPDGIDFSVGNAMSLVAFLCVAVAWGSGLMRALSGFSSILLLCAAIGALMPVLITSDYRFPYATEAGAAIHIAIAFSAYALFCVAALLALSMVSMERRLRHGIAGAASRRVMPLLTLERFLFRLILLGFILLTLTVISGVFFSEEIFGQHFTLNHKTTLSIISWFVFGTLLFGRWRFGWRGRKAFYWILAGTVLLIMAYLGYKFIMEVLM